MSDGETQSLAATQAFKPIKVGKNELAHRIVMTPLTRFRAANDHEPSDLELEYYTQRADTPGSLITAEGTFPSQESGGYPNIPGLWSESQTKGWKKIVDSVHEKKCFFNAQLWSLGRQADPEYLASKGLPYISASEVYINDEGKQKAEKAKNPLHALTKKEIKDHVNYYINAAKNAIFGAGFDYVEIHSANGYILDQFLQKTSNKRTDEYGGSVENRSRFLFEVLDGVIDAVGAEKISVRLSPWGTFGGMAGDSDPEIIATYSYVLAQFEKRRQEGKELAYVSLVEPRVSGDNDAVHCTTNNDWILLIWKGNIMRAGGFANTTPDYTRIFDTVSENNRTLIGIGRYYIANPDLVKRLHDGIELNSYNRDTFYASTSYGYTTYPFAGEERISKDDPASKREPKPLV